ncbi:hypothetical protein HFP15_21625 [Amycolatopsis sp. K13G38]|uniref:Uncharacterized protein n=1 Tax=Amycolatopsis acididurans TaxID=2724524 RepID=A0ABX1J6P3_9PSEU|nr:hypothetical protein [Amycolatopsis acididurans]NKQ55488.1 hypothetical protein [Amycolatopsis acididurans]
MLALILAVVAGICLAAGWLWEQVIAVYVALGASVAGLVLVLGQVWLRRREAAKDTVDEPDPEPGEDLTLPEAEHQEQDEVVFVLPGRKRFHVSGCRILDGKVAEELTLAEAEEESFTACSVCASREADELVAH